MQRFGEIDALRRILAGVSCAAVGLLISVVFRMMMPLIRRRDWVGAGGPGRGVYRDRGVAAAAAGGVAGGDPAQRRHHLCHAPAGGGMNSDQQPDPDAGMDLRTDVAVRGRRRQFGDPRNAPGRGRRPALDDRQAVRRCLRDIAAVAGAERADRHPDRLCRRRRRRRAGRNTCDVRADGRAGLLCEPVPAAALEPFALARHDPGGAGSACRSG